MFQKSHFASALLGMASLLGMVGYVHATPILGQGLPTDASALAGGTVVDFESVGVFNGPSLTLSGVTFTGNNGIGVDKDFSGGFNTRGDYHLTNHGKGQFTFEFAAPVDAFAFLWGAADLAWELSAFNGDSLVEKLLLSPTRASNFGDYFGIAAKGITHATLSITGGNDYVLLDNFTYQSSASVPEPNIFALMGLGLATLGWSSRRRRRA